MDARLGRMLVYALTVLALLLVFSLCVTHVPSFPFTKLGILGEADSGTRSVEIALKE